MVQQVVLMVKICHYYMMIRMSRLLMFIIIISISNLGISEANGKCQQEASCVSLKNTTCLGVTLPYKYTSVGIFAGNHLRDESEIRGYLALQKAAFQSVPRCWTSLQPFICTLYFPKCDDGQISLPSKEMCKTARNNCKFIENYLGIDSVPSFLNCDESYMQPDCGYGYKDVKLISPPSKCKYPLTSTEDSNIWYPGFEGCGVQCESPVLSEKDQRNLTSFIKYSVTISSIFLLFSAINFLVDWKSSNKYPPVIIFYSCICLLLHNLGWSLQFWTSKQDIVCRPDNTRRYGEPSTSESFSCLLSFALIYYFSTAAMIWIVILAFLWDSKFGKPNGFKNFVASKEGYFHIIAWSIPFILTITIISIGEVDSSPMLGICYVGLDKVIVRIFVVFIPIIICATCALIYFSRSVIDLKKILHHKNNQARKGNSEIKKMIIRIVFFSIFISAAVMGTVLCTIYDFNYLHVWVETLTKRITCSLDLIKNIAPEKANECQSKNGINLFFNYIQLFLIFTSGIAVSSWSFTEKSLAAWRRLILKKCDMNPNRPMSGRKHEMVANGYNHRSEIAQGCYSSFVRSIHGDPVDMGLTSATSQEISSEFARVFPKFLFRRGAVTDLKENNYLQDYTLNNSSTSDLYQPVHPMNFLINKRASFDSRISNESEIAEIMKHVKRKTRKERRKNFFQGLSGPSYRNNTSPGQSFVLPVSHMKNGVNRSTSTTELRDSSNGVHHSIYGVIPPFPFSPPSYPTPANCPFPSLLPILPSKQPIVQSRKCLKPSSEFTFTHGMAQNHDRSKPQLLTNPLMEKRRPDSRMNSVHESSPVNVSNHQANLGVGYLNSVNFMPPMGGSHFNPLYNNSSMVNPCLGNPMPYLGYPTAAPGAFNPYYGQSVNPFVCGNGKGIQTLDELANITKEREKFLPLITGVDTASEDGRDKSSLNIQISDSEAYQSDNGYNGAFVDGGPSELVAAQRLVDERIERIEARVKDESDN